MSEERKYYAHSFPGVPAGPQWQELRAHLSAVAAGAADYGRVFQSADWAHNAGWLHDFGKGDDSFQAYLLRQERLAA